MERVVYGVLLDTVSIQRYVFSTNNLKENIGASHIVEDIYDSHLKAVIKEMFLSIDDDLFDSWEKSPDTIVISSPSVPFEIGYIGGGNAFLLFKDEAKAKEFVNKWTMRLLVHCPGLTPASAIAKIDFNDFSSSLKALFKKLAENKSSFIPETVIRRHGITAECPRTGYSAEVWALKLPNDKQNYISSVSNAKIEASEMADRRLQLHLEECSLASKYTFTNQLDKLGQSRGDESYIAIVHIDGNNMGERFKAQNNLKDLRDLCISLKEATLNSFKSMLKKVDEDFNLIKDGELNIQKDGYREILPLRPIIIGGDDITFVSDGRLGLWLAKVFLDEFQRQRVSDNKPITACAGVAITKTKYPFYRGYTLSEELTKNAKEERKSANDNGSWIDFHIAYGGFSGSLSDIRKTHYMNSGVRLFLRPYKTSDFDELLLGVSHFKKRQNGKPQFPRSKIMDLRQVLYLSSSEQRSFLQLLKARGLSLPKYKDFSGEEVVMNNITPYLDMIELMDLYPEFAIIGGKE